MSARTHGIPSSARTDRSIPHVVRLAQHAAERGAAPAITYCGSDGTLDELSWADLDRRSNAAARALADAGVREGDLVSIVLPNLPLHFVATYAIWKLGAWVLPLNTRMPSAEQARVLDVARPRLVVGDVDLAVAPTLASTDLEAGHDDSPLALRIAERIKAIASGGSTGLPKLIVEARPLLKEPEPIDDAEAEAHPTLWSMIGLRPNGVQLISGPLYHNAAFSWSHTGLFEGQHLVLMDRFEADRALELLDRFAVTYAFFVPTALLRMLRADGFEGAELRQLAICHSAAVCPPWLKEAWIRKLGATRVYEIFGATEAVGAAVIRGDEWLTRRGSVGRGFMTDIRIRDEHGADVPAGTVAEIYTRWSDGTAPIYEYLGHEKHITADGFTTLGDLGYLDKDGYLYTCDRRVDLIISGGSNVYPAEVEAVLLQHPGVRDAAVVGVPDEDWGRRVHAVIEASADGAGLDLEALRAFCLTQLTPYKVPKTWQAVERLPRDEVGKIRRRLVAETAERECGS